MGANIGFEFRDLEAPQQFLFVRDALTHNNKIKLPAHVLVKLFFRTGPDLLDLFQNALDLFDLDRQYGHDARRALFRIFWDGFSPA